MSQTPDGAVEQLLRVLEKLPFVSTLKRDVQQLRAILYERRAPRVAVVGRRGSGRSRLGNALLGCDALPIDRPAGQNQWVRVDAHGSRLDWLEIGPGICDGDAESELLDRALGEAHPDVILIACAPSDLDGDIAAVVAAAAELSSRLGSSGVKPKVAALLTRADEVTPLVAPGERWPEAKEQAVDLLRQRLAAAVAKQKLEVKSVAAVAATDPLVGIEELTDLIFEALPDVARLEAARALASAFAQRRAVANQVVHSCSTLALTIGLAPVPLSDAFIIAPLQVVMVSAIAHLSGRPWDQKAAVEWIGSMGIVGGAGLGLRWTAQQLVKLVPGAGTLVSAGVAGAGTATLGQSAIAYFLREGPRELPSR